MRAVLLALAAMAGAAPALAGASAGSILAYTAGTARRSLPEVPAGPLVQIKETADALTSRPSTCTDAYLLIEFNEFHAHTLASRPADDAVKQQVLGASDVVGAAHVSGPAPLSVELAQALEAKCGTEQSQWVAVTPSDVAALGGMAGVPSHLVRLQADLEHESDAVAEAMGQFTKIHPDGMVLLSAHEPETEMHTMHTMHKRSSSEPWASAQQAHKQSTSFVSKYQFFTSDLLLAAIVVSVLFVPVVWVFIKLLADIQTPDRLGEKSALTQMAKKAQ